MGDLESLLGRLGQEEKSTGNGWGKNLSLRCSCLPATRNLPLKSRKQNKKLPAKTEQQEPDLESHIDNPQIDKIV